MTEVLAHKGRALTPEETEQLLRDRLGDHVQQAVVEYGVFTLWISPDGWLDAARTCRDERLLAYDMFDSLFGVDAREDGIDVVAVLYSTSTGNRIALRARCEGGREAPSLPSVTEVYRGAEWMERETYDMFGVDFSGHPGLEPRILTVENFEGWPLRKDFHLASRVAKPWPGVAEPVELDEEGNKIERERTIGDAPGPYELDKAMAEQAKVVNAPPPAPAVEPEAQPAEPLEGQPPGAADSPAPDSADTTDGSEAGGDPAARAKAKADERRKRQAEARAAKARARAEKAKQAEAAPAAEEDVAPAAEAAPAAEQPKAGSGTEAPDEDEDPRVAARRKRQAEARAARAKARADKAAGSGGGAAEDATSSAPQAPAETVTEASDTAAEPAAAEPAREQPAAGESSPPDDPAAAAKAKAEARRKRQAELRAARAKARAEKAEQSETDGEEDA
ncbi:MAG: NADH-quinone oxidoreductase subunit C [Nitriliruptoraceae bacterium]